MDFEDNDAIHKIMEKQREREVATREARLQEVRAGEVFKSFDGLLHRHGHVNSIRTTLRHGAGTRHRVNMEVLSAAGITKDDGQHVALSHKYGEYVDGPYILFRLPDLKLKVSEKEIANIVNGKEFKVMLTESDAENLKDLALSLTTSVNWQEPIETDRPKQGWVYPRIK